jgi:RsiW-degrading membrane proteinase PrsW (M82 family)
VNAISIYLSMAEEQGTGNKELRTGNKTQIVAADHYFMENAPRVETAQAASARQPSGGLYGLMLFAALGGGYVAVAVAMLPAAVVGGESLLHVALAPLYEEAFKPLGVFFVFLRWPHVALSRLRVALLSAAGGLTFALVESWLYVEAHPEGGVDYALFRFTAPVAMHVVSSFTFGLGITPALIAWFKRGTMPPRVTGQAFLTAVGIHTFYNATVLIMAASGGDLTTDP